MIELLMSRTRLHSFRLRHSTSIVSGLLRLVRIARLR